MAGRESAEVFLKSSPTHDVKDASSFGSLDQVDLGEWMRFASLCRWRDEERSTEGVSENSGALLVSLDETSLGT